MLYIDLPIAVEDREKIDLLQGSLQRLHSWNSVEVHNNIHTTILLTKVFMHCCQGEARREFARGRGLYRSLIYLNFTYTYTHS